MSAIGTVWLAAAWHWFAGTAFAQATRRHFGRWLHATVFLLEYEPTWFGEFACGVGLILWAAGAFFTDDIVVQGWAWLLPALAVMLGVARCVILVRLWYFWRVVFAATSATLVSYLIVALIGRYGWVPQLGWVAAAWTIEMLTAAKFSIPCLREIIGERPELGD